MLFTWPWFVSVVTISSSQCNHEEFFQGWSFCILSLKRNYTVYIEHLPTITKQCITILCYTVDTILQLIEHVSAHTKKRDITWVALITITSLHKQISKKKSSWCRTWDESMNALADKVHKQGATQWYALHNTATFNNHPYISSSGMPLGAWFTATYM